MSVTVTIETDKGTSDTLSFADIKKNDGLYQYREDDTSSWCGIAVVEEGSVVLLADPDGLISEKTLKTCWPNTQFRRVPPGQTFSVTITQDR